MKELKKHLPVKGQVQKLKSRGLIIDDEQAAVEILSSVNYYRFTGYLHDFRLPNSDNYISSISFSRIKRIYDFDRKLARILMFALEDIEETFKTRLSYCITSAFPDNPTVYLSRSLYRENEPYIEFVNRFHESVRLNKELPFVKHHIDNYDGNIPMWVAVELFTMGNLRFVYSNLLPRFQKEIAHTYQTGHKQLANWLKNLNRFRNHIAHNMRLYNLNFGHSPAKCKKHHHINYVNKPNMAFDQIFIIKCMYSDPEEWNYYVIPEIQALFEEYQDVIELSGLGFPENWEIVLKK